MKKNILITGGSGFIASHVIDYLLHKSQHNLIVLQRSSNVGSVGRLHGIGALGHSRVSFHWKDLRDAVTQQDMLEYGSRFGHPHVIVHMAASTHVDRSISNPVSFVQDNVLGTMNLLEYCRTYLPDALFLYFSTDEVFGPARLDTERDIKPSYGRQLEKHMRYMEWDRYNSTNPYAASKAAAEELCLAWANTYAINMLITHTMNVFGERQHPEKFIPLVIDHLATGKMISIHADSTKTKAGSRCYIHASRVAQALAFLIDSVWPEIKLPLGYVRDKINIVGDLEVDNLMLVQMIASIMGKSITPGVHYELVDFHSSRPGHDLRYSLDGIKLKACGFSLPPHSFEEDLRNTVKYYMRQLN